MTRDPYITALLALVLTGAGGCSQGSGGGSSEVAQETEPNFAPIGGVTSRIADPDLEWIHNVCIQGFKGDAGMPVDEAEKFCNCVRDEVATQIDAKHRASIRNVREFLALDRIPPEGVFEKSGLKYLVEASQDRCAGQLWPEPQQFSEEEHEKFESLANRSVEEFSAMLDQGCEDLVPGEKRERCLKAVAIAWMQNHASQYESVPDYYITGSDLAQAFLDN